MRPDGRTEPARVHSIATRRIPGALPIAAVDVIDKAVAEAIILVVCGLLVAAPFVLLRRLRRFSRETTLPSSERPGANNPEQGNRAIFGAGSRMAPRLPGERSEGSPKEDTANCVPSSPHAPTSAFVALSHPGRVPPPSVRSSRRRKRST
jgi:hypothetical protein